MLAAIHRVMTIGASLAVLFSLSSAQAEGTNLPSPALRRSASRVTSPAFGANRALLPTSANSTNQGAAIPPAPDGVTDLKFSELFKPIGKRGLEHSEKLRGLDGRRVRILGYMVRQSRPLPWTFLLTPVPLALHEAEYGFAEDMPATVLHVQMQRNATPIVPYTPGLLLLTGTLSVGNREEPDGRVSTVRLALDPPTPAERAALTQAGRSPTLSASTNALTK